MFLKAVLKYIKSEIKIDINDLIEVLVKKK